MRGPCACSCFVSFRRARPGKGYSLLLYPQRWWSDEGTGMPRGAGERKRDGRQGGLSEDGGLPEHEHASTAAVSLSTAVWFVCFVFSRARFVSGVFVLSALCLLSLRNEGVPSSSVKCFGPVCGQLGRALGLSSLDICLFCCWLGCSPPSLPAFMVNSAHAQ